MPTSLDRQGSQLTLSAKGGDGMPSRADSEFRSVFDAYYQRIRDYASRFVDSALADDVAQETFVSVWELTYAQGNPPRNVEALLVRKLRHRLADVLREGQREEIRDDQHVIDIADHLETASATSHAADGNLLAERIVYLMAGMPEATRKVFQCAWNHDWDLAEAAAELNMPFETARGHFTRAKHRLGIALQKEGYSIPPMIPRGRSGGRKGKEDGREEQ